MATLQQQDVAGVRVVRLSGSLTQQGVEGLEPDFEAALPDGTRAVVDLAGVDLITTPGLTLILSADKRLKNSSGRVVFAAPTGAVMNMLKRCRLDEVLDLTSDRDQAMERARN
jgi:anti-anti-sigma factor